MAANTAANGIARGYALDRAGVARLKAAGVRTIYCAADGELPGSKFNLRKGERLAVPDGLRTFGSTRKQMQSAIKLVHSWGATILDIDHGENSRDHCVEMLDRALSHRPLSSRRASELAELSVASKRAKKWPEEKAERAWHDPNVKTIPLFFAMTNWPQSSAYAAFGPRFAYKKRFKKPK